jgi:serine/threonine protein kinase
MTSMSIDELGRLVVRLHLLEPWQLDECLSRLGPSRKDATALLRAMESKHYLTSYQVSRLERGETDGLLLGEYKLMYRNASGSFARVFRACSIADGRMVGLKLLRKRWAEEPAVVAQFHREAELCKKLNHKNIVPIYEVYGQGEFHYFTMEFVEGGNLRDFIKIRKKLSPAEATRCLIDICEGLNYALGMGVTHRDLKLTNVLMSTQGIAKLVDFGLAGDDGLSGRGPGDGTQRALEYATLEKWTTAPANDPRSDLFFAGAMYYELLTGEPPYPRTRDREERKRLARYRNIRPIRDVDPNVPASVVRIIERLTKIDPEQRYQHPSAVLDDLNQVAAELRDKTSTPRVVPKDEVTNGATTPLKTLPTVMCIESRGKQQDILREYLSKHGFRVLVLSDLQRGMDRLASNCPDCIVLMGESIGRDVVDAYRKSSEWNNGQSLISIAVLAERQSEWMDEMEQTPTSRVLIQPIQLRELRREIHMAFQRRLHDRKHPT